VLTTIIGLVILLLIIAVALKALLAFFGGLFHPLPEMICLQCEKRSETQRGEPCPFCDNRTLVPVDSPAGHVISERHRVPRDRN
jgi:hypothetical protein